MSRSVDNGQDIIDSRDVIQRIAELEDEHQTVLDAVTDAETALESFEETNPQWELDEAQQDERGALQETLKSAQETAETWSEDTENPCEECEELKILRALADEASGSPDWTYGETLIRDSYFREYAQDLANDIGAMPDTSVWPCTCIDWERAVEELQQDYMSVEFGDETYWIRT